MRRELLSSAQQSSVQNVLSPAVVLLLLLLLLLLLSLRNKHWLRRKTDVRNRKIKKQKQQIIEKIKFNGSAGLS